MRTIDDAGCDVFHDATHVDCLITLEMIFGDNLGIDVDSASMRAILDTVHCVGRERLSAAFPRATSCLIIDWSDYAPCGDYLYGIEPLTVDYADAMQTIIDIAWEIVQDDRISYALTL